MGQAIRLPNQLVRTKTGLRKNSSLHFVAADESCNESNCASQPRRGNLCHRVDVSQNCYLIQKAP